MIKHLKRKFIAINVLSVLIVMFIAFCCNYAFNKANMYNESLHVMENSITEGTPKSMQTYLVLVNNYGRIYQVRGYTGALSNDFDDVSEYVTVATNAKGDIGDIPNVHLRFMKKSTPHGRIIAFTSTVEENLALEGMVRFSFYIFLCCAIIFFGLSVYLAGITTAPVEESIERRKQFVSDASHELKTPITAIVSSAEVLMTSEHITNDDRTWIKGIKESASDMSVLVNDMLNLARVEDDNPSRTVEDVNLSDCAMSAALNYECVLFEANKVFDTDIDSDVIVRGNTNELKKLINIFLDNARKYSNENGTIRLTLKSLSDKAVLTVFNTGEPIPQDEITNIFERFYRVDKVRSGASGYGLGLSIAKSIAENHSTKIYVTSDSNGTAFTVAFKNVKSH